MSHSKAKYITDEVKTEPLPAALCRGLGRSRCGPATGRGTAPAAGVPAASVGGCVPAPLDSAATGEKIECYS